MTRCCFSILKPVILAHSSTPSKIFSLLWAFLFVCKCLASSLFHYLGLMFCTRRRFTNGTHSFTTFIYTLPFCTYVVFITQTVPLSLLKGIALFVGRFSCHPPKICYPHKSLPLIYPFILLKAHS